MRLPDQVYRDVTSACKHLSKQLGAIRFEWAHDGERVWILQLHKGKTESSHTELVPGDAAHWITFNSQDGLEALRKLLQTIPPNTGVVFDGIIGLTSHLSDLVRKSRVPARFSTKTSQAIQQQLPFMP